MAESTRAEFADPRRHPRISANLPAQLLSIDQVPILPRGSEDCEQNATCVDIGLGGVQLRAQQVVFPGTHVRIRLTLPDQTIFESEARVAWSKVTLRPTALGTPHLRTEDSTIGLAFCGLTPESVMPIAEFIVAQEGSQPVRA